MENISLAAKYRPQNFASMLGQDTIKKVLSEAAFQNKVAPAYLLSGTRGVGKTTIARIFAKALNCERADTRSSGEPCNECSACKNITQGSFVDVLEMDGASNRGIDDAKRIKEIVQYAPLEGKYKVIIIDEAHMLTKEAFNTLLKTLEEPPSYTTFILATTEAHKFPITIISRCQHFVCKQIPENHLKDHLKFVLDSEQRPYDEEAVKIIAKRGAGSVRDSMSLLDQTLALAGDSTITDSLTRTVLGLAEKDILNKLLLAIAQNNPLEVAKCVQNMTLQGLDIAYFLRELAQLWRSFFLLKKYGDSALELLEISSDEANELVEMAKPFTPAFVHSAWQMTLEAQRKITTGLEPAVTLELFLINLTLLPELLPINELNISTENLPLHSDPVESQKKKLSENSKEEEPAKVASKAEVAITVEPVIEAQSEQFAEQKPVSEELSTTESLVEMQLEPEAHVEQDESVLVETIENIEENIEPTSNSKDLFDVNSLEVSNFLEYLKNNTHLELYNKLQHIKNMKIEESSDNGEYDYTLTIFVTSRTNEKQLDATACKNLEALLFDWSGHKVKVILDASNLPKSPVELKEQLEKMPIIQEIQSLFGAHISYCEAEKVD